MLVGSPDTSAWDKIFFFYCCWIQIYLFDKISQRHVFFISLTTEEKTKTSRWIITSRPETWRPGGTRNATFNPAKHWTNKVRAGQRSPVSPVNPPEQKAAGPIASARRRHHDFSSEASPVWRVDVWPRALAGLRCKRCQVALNLPDVITHGI